MEKVRIEDIDRRVDSSTVLRPLTSPLNASNVAINYYELAPGDSFAYGYHMHEDQEEIFVIQHGTATFETATGEVAVSAGEAIRFGPGEYQQGTNTGTERVVALAIGAPRGGATSEILRRCESCEERTPQTIERVADGKARITRCLECGSETARFE